MRISFVRWWAFIIGLVLVTQANGQFNSNPYFDSLRFSILDEPLKSGYYLDQATQWDSIDEAVKAQKLSTVLATTDSLLSQVEVERAQFLRVEKELIQGNQNRIYFFSMASVALLVMIVLGTYFYWRQRREWLSSLEKTEQELASTQAKQERFFSVVARDLKQPVSSLTQFAKTLQTSKDEISSLEMASMLKQLATESSSVAQSIDNLAEWSVIQTGVFSVKRERFNLLPLIHETMDQFKHPMEQKQLKMDMLVPDLLFVMADRSLMLLVFRNLLSNAIRYSPPGGTLVFFGGRKESLITVGLRDFGKGMSVAEQRKVFVTTSSVPESRGTGLLLAYELVRACGGKMSVESDEGKGSTFYLTLPEE
jgi:signal transduction histidine kinase